MKKLSSVLIVIGLISLYVPKQVAAGYSPNTEYYWLMATTKNVATSTVKLLPELKPICACESAGNKNAKPRHYNKDGEVLRGRVNPADVGLCQINLAYHNDEAQENGFDLFSEEGNIGYANYLYRKSGNAPWIWSKPCWE